MFSIFTATRRIDVTSEATIHFRITAFPCINVIIDSLQKNFPSQFNNYPVFYIESTGCTSQFHSRFIFALITHFNPDYTIQCYYNERQHGMGPMEGGGGTTKHLIEHMINTKKQKNVSLMVLMILLCMQTK